MSNIKEMNLRLADNLSLTRVHEKSKVSLRPLARKNFILDALQKQPVYEGYNELYKVCSYVLSFLFWVTNVCGQTQVESQLIIPKKREV